MLIGIIAGKLVLLGLALIGLAAVVAAAGPLFAVIKIAGAVYLIWLGVKTWCRGGAAALRDGAPTGSLLSDATLGFAMALANPIAIGFYVALLPNTIDIGTTTLADGLALGGLLCAAMAVIGGVYIGFARGARRLFASPPARRCLDRGAGVVMVGAGVALATR